MEVMVGKRGREEREWVREEVIDCLSSLFLQNSSIIRERMEDITATPCYTQE